jgi:hypothetical protein
MRTTSIIMWDYWRDKRGSPVEALECDYRDLMESDNELRELYLQIQRCNIMIDTIMCGKKYE